MSTRAELIAERDEDVKSMEARIADAEQKAAETRETLEPKVARLEAELAKAKGTIRAANAVAQEARSSLDSYLDAFPKKLNTYATDDEKSAVNFFPKDCWREREKTFVTDDYKWALERQKQLDAANLKFNAACLNEPDLLGAIKAIREEFGIVDNRPPVPSDDELLKEFIRQRRNHLAAV